MATECCYDCVAEYDLHCLCRTPKVNCASAWQMTDVCTVGVSSSVLCALLQRDIGGLNNIMLDTYNRGRPVVDGPAIWELLSDVLCNIQYGMAR